MPTLIVGPTRASISSPSCLPITSGQIASVPIKPFGPCCSVEPIGMIMPFECLRYESTSSQVCRWSCMTCGCFTVDGGERSGGQDRAAADRARRGGDRSLDLRLAELVLEALAHLGDELPVVGAVLATAGGEIETLRVGGHRLDREGAGNA